ncbi:MAG: hypothetical protein INH41_12735 [Myxococcaceae bacterium]|jgi:hypothetical protein|nr:hypothetical protein [Myxococcaceae bacterium]
MRRTALPAVLALIAGCEPPVSAVRFTTWGEAYIEAGIPAQAGAEDGFVDGWAVTFSRFLVVLNDITVADAQGQVASRQPGAKAFDLVRRGPVEVYAATAPARRYEQVSYAIAPDDTATAGNLDAADLALLTSRKASVIVVGSAKKDAVTKTFDWTFTTATTYADCARAGMSGKGVVLTAGAEAKVELTVHGDHFFYDQLGNDAALRFQALADADANADGRVTLEELAAVQLTTLPQGLYGTASVANVRTLRDFVTQNVRTIGHYDGEGECVPKAR